jgi:hypothetical protein
MAFRDLIRTNFRRKLFSLLLAILVWATIHFAENKQRGSVSPIPSIPSTNAPTVNP